MWRRTAFTVRLADDLTLASLGHLLVWSAAPCIRVFEDLGRGADRRRKSARAVGQKLHALSWIELGIG